MNIFNIIYRKTQLGKTLQFIYHWINQNLVPTKIYLKRRFKKKHGFYPNLIDPQTLNEKIIWLKLYDKTELHTICADKYRVREFIKNEIGEKYLVPLILKTEQVQDLTPKNLPDAPFIIKTNHDSGGGIIVKDKNSLDWEESRITLEKRLKHNHYKKSKEWQYKNIKPLIIVEKLLQTESGDIPFDYKLHCFNGKVRMIQVDMGRGTDNHYRNWYNIDWEREPYKWSSPKDFGKATDPSEEDIEKPPTLNEMILLSEHLAKSFIYVRVDWYDVDGKLYFGELTFHHDGGNQKILPEIWDKKLGSELILKPSL